MSDKRSAILAEIPRLRRYARALLRDREAADDLVQDCLERALRKLDNWRTGDSPRPWLFTIMHHLFVDQRRKIKRRGEEFPLSYGEVADISSKPSQLDRIAVREVGEALQSIAADRRAALVLVTIEGLSYAEAAVVLGIPAGTLMSRVARGREELRAILDDTARRKSIRIVEK